MHLLKIKKNVHSFSKKNWPLRNTGLEWRIILKWVVKKSDER